MTRLAIIFSLLFVTPANAETFIMECRGLGIEEIWKYEEGFFSDTCYERVKGKWREHSSVKAVNQSCIFNDKWYIDFVSKEYARGAHGTARCATQDSSGRWVR